VTIASLDDWVASAKQYITWSKTAARTTVATGWFTELDLAGNPGAGTLAGTSTTAGVVPTDATAGMPLITNFGGGASGYLSKIAFSSSVACRVQVFDLLWKGGAYAFNANTALSGQPSFASRCPGGLYNDLEIWVEQVTAATGNQAVNVTYVNQAGTTGRTTGAVGIGAAPTVGRCWQLPLAAGDVGVQTITNVAGATATAGTFNVLVLRSLWFGRVPVANGGDVHAMDKTGLIDMFQDMALYPLIAPDSTAIGIPDIRMQIANH